LVFAMVGDLARMIGVALVGALLAYVVQPWLFQSGIIDLPDVRDIPDWLAQQYTLGVSIVFFTCILTTLTWYLIALFSKSGKTAREVAGLRPIWGLLLLLPVLSVIGGIYFNKSNDALLWVTLLYIGDALLCYWLATAISSPGLFKYVPPFAFLIRNLVRLK
jgi:hypothetical protein